MTESESKTRQPLRVLVVEDQMVIAMEIEDILQELGCVVVGPVGRLDAAVRLARDENLDVAILDVNLDGVEVFPAATELQTRGIPFIFSTGYAELTLPPQWRDVARLTKPFRSKDLGTVLKKVSKRALND